MTASKLQRSGLAAVLALAAGFSTANPILVEVSSTPIRPAITSGQGEARAVPFFPAAGNPLRWQGFMRVANHSDAGGDVVIRAIDDGGRDFGTVTLTLDAGETVHVNSSDLEDGNATKGLAGRFGSRGQGDWRLEVTSDLRIEVLAYVRTSDGFVTPMHDVAPAAQAGTNTYRVVTFNPGSNYRQESLLRLVNPGGADAAVSIRGVDDQGRSAGPVRLAIGAGASRTVSALALEEGASDLDGTLGDGGGKWQLEVESSDPLLVMSLLATPTGHVTNLSTAPGVSLVGTGAATPPPDAPVPPAPEVSITSPTEFDVVWVADLDAGTVTYDVQFRYQGTQWSDASECAKFSPDVAGTYRLTVSIELPSDLALVAGRTVQARYRDRAESFCGSAASSPGPWSEVGEVRVPEAPAGWGALSIDFYVSNSCPGLAAGIALDHRTESAAASAARRACRQDGGSTAECDEETYTFEGCAAMSYGEDGEFPCGIFSGDSPTSLAVAERDALADCRTKGYRNCRIWANRRGTRISGCNAAASGVVPVLSRRANELDALSAEKKGL